MAAASRLPVMGPESFEEQVRAMGSVVVCFVADWCGFCARFLPGFAQRAAKGHGDLRFAVADLSDYDDPRWEAFSIGVVPTLVHFVDGAPVQRLDGRLGYGIDARQLEAFLHTAASESTLDVGGGAGG